MNPLGDGGFDAACGLPYHFVRLPPGCVELSGLACRVGRLRAFSASRGALCHSIGVPIRASCSKSVDGLQGPGCCL